MTIDDSTVKIIMVSGAVLVILMFYYMYTGKIGTVTGPIPVPVTSSQMVDPSVPCEGFEGGVAAPSESNYNEVYATVPSAPLTAQYPADLFPKDSITSPAELLPKDTNSAWAQSVPNVPGELGDANFLTAGYHM